MALQLNQKKQFGPSGVADVKLMTKTIRVTFKDGDVFELPLEVWEKGRPGGEFIVTLNKTADKLVGLKPTAGTHIVRFSRFANLIDTVPTPRIQRGGKREGKGGQSYIAPDKMVFDALLTVLSEDRFEGLNILSILPYGFEPQPGTPFATINVAGKRDLERIEQFLRLTGYDFNVDIPFSPNVLPWLEESLKRSAKVFMVTTGESGFIDSMAEVPASLLGALGTPKKKGKK